MPETGAGRISLVQHDDATQLNCLNLSICKKMLHHIYITLRLLKVTSSSNLGEILRAN